MSVNNATRMEILLIQLFVSNVLTAQALLVNYLVLLLSYVNIKRCILQSYVHESPLLLLLVHPQSLAIILLAPLIHRGLTKVRITRGPTNFQTSTHGLIQLPIIHGRILSTPLTLSIQWQAIIPGVLILGMVFINLFFDIYLENKYIFCKFDCSG